MTNHHSWRKGRICESCAEWKLLRDFKGDSRECRSCAPSKRTPIPRTFVPKKFLDFQLGLQAPEGFEQATDSADEESLVPSG